MVNDYYIVLWVLDFLELERFFRYLFLVFLICMVLIGEILLLIKFGVEKLF